MNGEDLTENERAIVAAVAKAAGCDDWSLDFAKGSEEPLRVIYRAGGFGVASLLGGDIVSSGRAHIKARRCLSAARKVWASQQRTGGAA